MIPCTNPVTSTFLHQAAGLLERQLTLETSCNVEAYVVVLDSAPMFVSNLGKLARVDGVAVPMLLSLEDARTVASQNEHLGVIRHVDYLRHAAEVLRHDAKHAKACTCAAGRTH